MKNIIQSLPRHPLGRAVHKGTQKSNIRRKMAVFIVAWISLAAIGLQSVATSAVPVVQSSLATASAWTDPATKPLLQAADAPKAVSKDETVYLTLRPDGGVEAVSVVNFLQVPSAGDYTDYGIYKDIRSLSLDLSPVLDGSRITWSLPVLDQGFYYQGTLENQNAPFLFRFEYSLDGTALPVSSLIGKSGKIKIKITVDPNPDTPAYFKSNYLCQIQLPFSLERVRDISAPAAQTVVVGKTATLAYVVLPGKSASFDIAFDANVFEMNAVAITSLPFSAGSYLGIDPASIQDGIRQLVSGSGALVSGTRELKAGLQQLSNGTAQLSNASQLLANGQKEIGTGLSGYQNGLVTLSGNMTQFSQGLAQLAGHSTVLAQGYSSLSFGVFDLLDAMSPLLLSLPVEQQTLYTMQIAGLKEQLNAYGAALNSYSGAITEISASAGQLAGGLSMLSSQGNSLVTGMAQSSQGLDKLHQGIAELGTHTSTLPNQVEKLIQGQVLLADGIKEAAVLLDTFPASDKTESPVSFVDPSISVHSVQFIMNIPEQKQPAAIVPNDSTAVRKTFWQRFADLFRA